MFDDRNGVVFKSARIVWGQVLDVFSSSGGGFAAERSLIFRPEWHSDVD
jgi:hypothetical protein